MKSILVVEDNPYMRQAVCDLIEIAFSVQPESACCVDEALEKLSDRSFDLIVSDLEMPRGSGLDLFRLLQSHQAALPFILFTGNDHLTNVPPQKNFQLVTQKNMLRLLEVLREHWCTCGEQSS